MAAGVPVVGTRVGGAPYLVDDGVTGQVVEPGDVEALVMSLAGILGDPARQRELGTAARACAERDFRVEVAARRLGEAYERLAEDYGRRLHPPCKNQLQGRERRCSQGLGRERASAGVPLATPIASNASCASYRSGAEPMKASAA